MKCMGVNRPSDHRIPAGPQPSSMTAVRELASERGPQFGLMPAGQALPAASITLGRMRVTPAQWLALAPSWKASLVRGVLESRGFPSINTVSRGQVVYDLVAQIDSYASRARPAGQARAFSQIAAPPAAPSSPPMPGSGGQQVYGRSFLGINLPR